MLTAAECSDRSGNSDDDFDCVSLGYTCEDGDRNYESDDPDCPDFVPEEPRGTCVTDGSGVDVCSVRPESGCTGTFDGTLTACSEVDYPWSCLTWQTTTSTACEATCDEPCEYLGDATDLELGTCEEVLLGVDACSDVPANECQGTFTGGGTCADTGFDWRCSLGPTFMSQGDCVLNCLSGGCQGEDAPTVGTDGVPAAGGVIGVSIVDRTELTLDFEIDVFVIDDDGDLISNLDQGDLSFMDNVFDYEDAPAEEDPFFSFTQNCFEQMQTPENGPYSAVMLMDQSGSITGTDPNDTRIDAAKIFFGALGPDDEAILAAFASAGSLQSDFVSWGEFGQQYDFDSTLDSLTMLEAGGTPFFDATVVFTDKVAAEGGNENKAVVVFTDGADTESTSTLVDAAENAVSKGVKVFTVGLSDAVDRGVLQDLAFQTGGSMMYTDEAANLIALYGTLGNLLSGGVTYYHTCWTVERDKQDFSAGTFNTSMRVEQPDGGYAYVPVHIVY